jgi:glycosyltransferase involved in cell wall biosynthesis
VAGTFVAAQVEALRAAGVEVDVVHPGMFRDFGVAGRDGIVQNLRARPWLLAAVPFFLASFALAARRVVRGADVVHAHWLPSALPALATGKPFALQVWGTDIELARRAGWVARPLLRRARVVVAASAYLAEEARALGAARVRVVPNGIEIPAEVKPPAEPAHVLFLGRLSEEKGIREFLEATRELPRVIVGDGPLRELAPEAVGFVPPGGVGAYYERAAVVCVPSRREGYGVVAREAMAYGRPVVATRVGGLRDVVVDGESGLVVPARDAAALRGAVETLLGDDELRRRLGQAARSHAFAEFRPERTAAELRDVLGRVADGRSLG